MRIGLMGGTFDPPTPAHACVAACARDHMRLNFVIFIPAHTPPHKTWRSDIVHPADRLAMLHLMLAESPWASVSDVEIKREGPSYTIDTIRLYKALLPNVDLVFIIGSDTLADLKNWRSIDELVTLVEFAVVYRDGRDWQADYAARPEGARVKRVITPYASAVSSTAIRSTKNFAALHPKVAEYIRERRLYGC